MWTERRAVSVRAGGMCSNHCAGEYAKARDSEGNLVLYARGDWIQGAEGRECISEFLEQMRNWTMELFCEF